MTHGDIPPDSTRERFECPSCSQAVWSFRGEPLDTRCPHCGSSLGLGSSLSSQGSVDSDLLETVRTNLIGQLRGARTTDLTTASPPSVLLQKVPYNVARRKNVLPIDDADGTITLAVPKGVAIDALIRLMFLLNARLSLVVAPAKDLRAAIDRVYER